MWALKEIGVKACNQSVRNLVPSGYIPREYPPGFWKHVAKLTIFMLCVNDFGVKYHNKADTKYLIKAIDTNHKATVDWHST